MRPVAEKRKAGDLAANLRESTTDCVRHMGLRRWAWGTENLPLNSQEIEAKELCIKVMHNRLWECIKVNLRLIPGNIFFYCPFLITIADAPRDEGCRPDFEPSPGPIRWPSITANQKAKGLALHAKQPSPYPRQQFISRYSVVK